MNENSRIENAAEVAQPADTGVDYIAAIQDIKANSVDRAKYDQLKEENQRLLKSLVNGETIEQEVKPIDVGEIRKELFSQDVDLTNLDYMTKVIQLRDTLIANGENDPFLPWGKKITPTQEDVDTAERVAEVIRECIEYAEGDSGVFTNELQRRMIDTGKNTPKRK